MSKRPNILLIQSDQHRYDCVGFSRDYPVRTPNIDRLAEEGMWFTHAFTPIPLCCPARQSLLNGRRPESFGCLWNYDLSLPMKALEPDEYAWPRELQASGYHTGYFGKWHVNPKHDPTAFGFEDYIGDADYKKMKTGKYPELTYKNGFFGESDPVALEDTHTHWMAQNVIDLINQYAKDGRPWHIRLDFHDPHLPCRPAGPFASMYTPENVPEWRSFKEDFRNKPYIQQQQLYNWEIEHFGWDEWAPVVARYYGAISQVDDAVGRVLESLDQLGISDDTIVIYTSDHGDMCGGHRMMDKHYILYDDVVRVPLVIRWPKVIEAGQRCDEFVYNMLDLPPTLMKAAGLGIPDFFHGRSLMPLLKGEPASDWRQDVVSTYNGQQFGLYTQRMIRTREWKYVWNTTDVDELYDLRKDPDELVNLIHDPGCHNIVEELRERLYHELTRDGDRLVANRWMKNQLLNNKKR